MGYQVLLAEDEARMRDIVRDYLAAHGWACDLARNCLLYTSDAADE